MADKNSLLVLRLEGVLQSWGDISKWDYRDTVSMPTKSGIIGLLACAMGIPRDHQDLEEFTAAVQVGVRSDRPGEVIVDFHTVTGNPMMAASGKPKAGGNTIITRHAYLQDASFLVVLAIDQPWMDRVVTALQNPQWSIYLGRKSCVPSRPIYEALTEAYADIEDALCNYPLALRTEYPVTYECEIPDDSKTTYTRSDELRPGYRNFVPRRVWRGAIKEKKYVSDEN